MSGTILDLKDLSTAGSISSGSNQLRLESNPGFHVGDQIIIEIGTEPGQGQRGTVGVGGTWPALNYAGSAERIAAPPPAPDTFAWDRDTGNVFQWLDGAWSQWMANDYYVSEAVPRSLVATIQAIDGSVITLDKTAAATASNANVYYDNAKWFWDNVGEGTSGFSPDNNTLIIPPGKFAFSSPMTLEHHSDWTIMGSGDQSEIFSPKGVAGAGVAADFCDGIVLRDFSIVSNAKNEGFGLAWNTLNNGSVRVDETTLPQGSQFPSGAVISHTHGGTIQNLTVVDVFQNAIGVSAGSSDINVYDCRVYVTEPLREYVQWMYQISDSKNVSVYDSYLESAYLVQGFEIFRSDDSKFVNMNSINGVAAVNSSGRFILEDMNITIHANSQFDFASFSPFNPIVNINTNIQPPAASILDGGAIINPIINLEGYINANNDVLNGIVVNADNPNITITGGYPNDPAAGGLIQYPDYSGSGVQGSQIVSDDAAITVDGIRVTGTTQHQIVAATGSIVENSVVDTIGGHPSLLNDQTNAEFSHGNDYAASTATTGSVAVGGSTTGNIETTSDADWLAITLTAGITYQFDLQGSATGQGTLQAPTLQLRDGVGNLLLTDVQSGGFGPGPGYSSRLIYTAGMTGTFYLASDPQTNDVGTYKISAIQLSTPSNHAPVITSDQGGGIATIALAENTTAVTTVTATDPDAGQTLSYSIGGGADAAKFTIGPSTGALSFVTAPNFELPTDAGGNNVYDVIVQASDGHGGIDTQRIVVTVSDVVENTVNHAPVVTQSGQPLAHGVTSVAASSLFQVSDADNDQIVKYRFWDGTTDPASGHFELNGSPVAQTPQSFELTAAQLAGLTYEPGSISDQLWFRAFDGQTWSPWTNFSESPPPDHAPVVTGSNQSVPNGIEVSVSSLFGVSDADGDQIIAYRFWDGTSNLASGHLEVNNVVQAQSPSAFEVPATQIGGVTYTAGAVPDDLWVRAFDGHTWSDWHNFLI
jgi:hypothetical protein